ncbi:urease accessory protein UreE, partial [Brucella sp. TWI432]
MQRVIKICSNSKELTNAVASGQKSIALKHDERRVRRKTLILDNNDKVLIDLPEPISLRNGEALVLEDGSKVIVIAASEPLYSITARSAVHLSELAWHIGNRHLAAEISADRILILRDHVIKSMLIGLGAS